MNVSKGQTLMLTYYPTKDKRKYYIITVVKTDPRKLLNVDKGKLTKLKTADSPMKFIECYP